MITDDSAASLLRVARQRAGISQVELARRAGVTQSVVSAYESGGRQPSLPMLTRIIDATGMHLEMTILSPTRLPSGGKLGSLLQRERQRVLHISEQHGMSNVRVFGSVARGDENNESDIDLLVNAPPGTGIFGLARYQHELEELLGVHIDVVPASGLKADVATLVLGEAVPL